MLTYRITVTRITDRKNKVIKTFEHTASTIGNRTGLATLFNQPTAHAELIRDAILADLAEIAITKTRLADESATLEDLE